MKINQALTLFILLLIGIGAFLLVDRYTGTKSEVAANRLEEVFIVNERAKQNDNGNADKNFDYQPLRPRNGTLKGVIELGSTGLNSFVVNIDKDKNWELIAKDFGASFLYEGYANEKNLHEGINNYVAKIFDNAVKKEDIHFVVSSGAQKNPKTVAIVENLKVKGYNIEAISPESEAKYGFIATVPPSFRDNSFFVDIGSGNTKITWWQDGKEFMAEGSGSKYFESNKSDSAVYAEFTMLADSIPSRSRAFCFIIGGVPFQLAEKLRTNEERYTTLNNPSYYKPTNKRTASGLNIYKAIYEATECKFFIFDWDANFTIGYLLDLPNNVKGN